MSFPKYPRYKDSGVEWLGDVPEHWTIGPLKRLLQINNGADHKAVEADEGYPVIGSGGPFAWASEYLYCGESVLLGRKGTIDKPLHMSGPFWAVDTMYWSKIERRACGRFAYYLATRIPFAFYSTNTALPSMTKSDLSAHMVAYPDLAEQRTIASFLDAEVARIDDLLAEQHRLIELLKEKRQAVISHAVTRGLDPDAPMKPAGVEWLGDIPSHWTTTKLKYAASLIVDCPHETPVYSDDGMYLVIRTADVDEGRLDPSSMRRVSEDTYVNRIRRSPVLCGDIVYGREGERWGHAALVPESGRYCLGQRMMQFRSADGINPGYLMWALNADATYWQGEQDTIGATSPHVNISTIRSFVLALPPQEEQDAIEVFLREHLGRFDDVIDQASLAITLLQERRTALISAAVTGKIDVRGIAMAEAA
jgi:type I restriction enzyme S subunit